MAADALRLLASCWSVIVVRDIFISGSTDRDFLCLTLRFSISAIIRFTFWDFLTSHTVAYLSDCLASVWHFVTFYMLTQCTRQTLRVKVTTRACMPPIPPMWPADRQGDCVCDRACLPPPLTGSLLLWQLSTLVNRCINSGPTSSTLSQNYYIGLFWIRGLLTAWVKCLSASCLMTTSSGVPTSDCPCSNTSF